MQFVTSPDGTRLAIDRVGSGEPLLVLSGALNTRASHADLAELLAPHFEVITLDRRGRGDSTDHPDYDPAREVADVAAVIDTVGGGGEVLVYGHSSGAVLAMRSYAAGVPIRRMALYEPPLLTDELRTADGGAVIAAVDAAIAEGRNSDAVATFLTRAVGLPEPAVDHLRQSPAWEAITAVAPTLRYDLRVVGDQRIPVEDCAAITIPVTVMFGEAGPPWARLTANALAAAIPGAELIGFADQTHGIAAAVLAPVLLRYFTA